MCALSSRILVRAISYTVHGLIPASCVFADRYNREEVVRSLGKEVNINPPLMLGQLPDTPEELLKLDQVSNAYFKNILIKIYISKLGSFRTRGLLNRKKVHLNICFSVYVEIKIN